MDQHPQLTTEQMLILASLEAADFVAASGADLPSVDAASVTVPCPAAWITDGHITIVCHSPAAARELADTVRHVPEISTRTTVEGAIVRVEDGASDLFSIVGRAGLLGLADICGIRPTKTDNARWWWRPVRPGRCSATGPAGRSW